MSHIQRFDHVGITVADLDTATAFFEGLGLEVEGRTFMEGEFVDNVIGIPDARSQIVTLRPPEGVGRAVVRCIPTSSDGEGFCGSRSTDEPAWAGRGVRAARRVSR